MPAKAMIPDYEPTPSAGQVPVPLQRLVCPKCGFECRPEELHPEFGRACPSCLRAFARLRMPKMVSVPMVITPEALDRDPLVPTTSVQRA